MTRQPATRNPQPATRNPQPATRNPQPATRNPADRLLLFAGRTSQALARLRYDVEPLFAPDPRLRIAYTLIPGSRFSSGAPDFARRNGIDLLPWSTARELAADLIVTSSPDPCLYEARAPVISLPHGAGHNRLRPELSGVSGLSPEQIRGPAGEVPAFLALPGPAAAERLAVDCPAALPHAEICGDVCLERLRASATSRDAYREALGVAPARRLVLLSSTWDQYALTRRSQTLPERLLAELPMDEFALAFIPHPNDELGDTPRTTGLLHPHLANGLIMIPPDEGWRAALIAADCVIGDHGSVTFFGAALGVPTLLAAFGFANMPPELPLARFGRTAPRFDRDAPAAPQLRRAIANGPLTFDFDSAIAEPLPGPAARLHRAAYEFLRLDPPKPPQPQPVPIPETLPAHNPTTSWHFAPGPEATWNRYPVSTPTTLPSYRAGHLVCDTANRDPRLVASANVLLRHREPVALPEALSTARAILNRYPIGQVVSVRIARVIENPRDTTDSDQSTAVAPARHTDQTLLLIRGGQAFLVRGDTSTVVPSLVYERLVEHPAEPFGFKAAVLLADRQAEANPALSIRPFEH